MNEDQKTTDWKARLAQVAAADGGPPASLGWPDPARPGVPMDPERCGAHVFEAGSPDYPIKGPWTLLWAWPEALWVDCFGNMEPPDCMAKFKYVGPCPTPAEHAAALAAEYRRAAVAMREALASWLMCGCDTQEQARVVTAATTEGPNSGARWRACHRADCMALIAAEALELPIPEIKETPNA